MDIDIPDIHSSDASTKEDISSITLKKARRRRRFTELMRDHMCIQPNCGRHYASSHALQAHIKLKHASRESEYNHYWPPPLVLLGGRGRSKSLPESCVRVGKYSISSSSSLSSSSSSSELYYPQYSPLYYEPYMKQPSNHSHNYDVSPNIDSSVVLNNSAYNNNDFEGYSLARYYNNGGDGVDVNDNDNDDAFISNVDYNYNNRNTDEFISGIDNTMDSHMSYSSHDDFINNSCNHFDNNIYYNNSNGYAFNAGDEFDMFINDISVSNPLFNMPKYESIVINEDHIKKHKLILSKGDIVEGGQGGFKKNLNSMLTV